MYNLIIGDSPDMLAIPGTTLLAEFRDWDKAVEMAQFKADQTNEPVKIIGSGQTLKTITPIVCTCAAAYLNNSYHTAGCAKVVTN